MEATAELEAELEAIVEDLSLSHVVPGVHPPPARRHPRSPLMTYIP